MGGGGGFRIRLPAPRLRHPMRKPCTKGVDVDDAGGGKCLRPRGLQYKGDRDTCRN